MSLIQSTAIPSGASYELEQSLRFNDNDSAHLSKTFASAGNRKTWSYSFWVKRTELGTGTANRQIFLEGYTSSTSWFVMILNDDALQIYDAQTSQPDYGMATARLFRDTSAWYHVLLAVDTTQSTDTNRVKLYINGINEPLTDQYGLFPLNYQSNVNSAVLHNIGKYTDISTTSDYYLSEVNFIDGAAKAPSDFGEFGTYGEWKPIEYKSSYGTNGFYLPFKQDYTVEGFSTVTWQGNSASSAYIGGAGFQPDLTWIKSRSIAASHNLVDSIRGANKRLRSDSSGAENNQSENGYVGSFDNDGFTLIQGSSTHNTYTGWFETNQSGVTYVAWNWDMGGSNATLTAGSINSVVRADATYGQSIVSFTGTGSNATVAHGLSSAPEMIIVRQRGANAWAVYHTSIGNTHLLELNTTAGKADNSSFWNDTSPTSSVFTIGSHAEVNPNGVGVICYAFHSVSGYSKISSYSGSGNANNSVTGLGFSPAWIMIKRTDAADQWLIVDNTRTPFGDTEGDNLYAEASTAEGGGNSTAIQFDSNGFTVKGTDTMVNGSGGTYIYMAFADKREYAYWLDQSGNNNDWTSNGLTESDISVDSPTNNFCTLNPLDSNASNNIVVSEGNLRFTNSGSNWDNIAGTFAFKTGKWYWEMLPISGSLDEIFTGIKDTAANTTSSNSWVSGSILWYNHTGGELRVNGTDTTANYGDLAIGDVLGVAVNMDDRQITFYKNNSALVSNYAIPSEILEAMPHALTDANTLTAYNFGQDSSFAGAKTAQGNADGNAIGDFFYTPPTGFLALCTKNLPEPAVIPSEHFNTVLYTGDDGQKSITGVGFQPDFIWFKARNDTYSHEFFDVVRGNTKRLISNTTAAEDTRSTATTFDSDGFTVGTGGDASTNDVKNYVAWNWKAGTSSNLSAAGARAIATVSSVNVDAGFEIITYTGNGTAGATIGHSLGVAPDALIIRRRNAANTWTIYLPPVVDHTKKIHLETTGAVVANGSTLNSTAPTSTVITLGNDNRSNGSSDTYVMYAFAEKNGYSKFGSYTGNGNADGTFVYTGFRPAFVMVKRSDTADNWIMRDYARSPDNPVNESVYANENNAEYTGTDLLIDMTSNGFKVRATDVAHNASGGTYIYLCFAETPFKHSNAR